MRISPKLFIGVGLLIVVGYFFADLVFNDQQYAQRLRQARRARNESFRRAASSPLSQTQRDAFDSLRYFAPDPHWRLEAELERFARPDTLALALTDGKAEAYLRWGRARFQTEQQAGQLTLFRKATGPDTTLFVPFTDKTNGFSTYGGGRYLDVALPPANGTTVTLDFNAAYNPYCAYTTAYACPVPPAENRLAFEIRAGEQEFHDHSQEKEPGH